MLSIVYTNSAKNISVDCVLVGKIKYILNMVVILNNADHFIKLKNYLSDFLLTKTSCFKTFEPHLL